MIYRTHIDCCQYMLAPLVAYGHHDDEEEGQHNNNLIINDKESVIQRQWDRVAFSFVILINRLFRMLMPSSMSVSLFFHVLYSCVSIVTPEGRVSGARERGKKVS